MMETVVNSSDFSDRAVILDRHCIRRTTGVPTVSLLVGPIGVCCRIWRRWAMPTGRSVVIANGNHFPYPEWVRAVLERSDLPTSAIKSLAQRANRDPDEF